MSKRKHHTSEEVRKAASAAKGKYYLANKNEVHRKNAEYAKMNPEKRRTWSRDAYKRNPEKHRERQRKYYKGNTDKCRQAHREYMKENPHLNNIYNKKRRIGTRKHPDASNKEIKKLYLMSMDIKNRTGVVHEVDHVIPLKSGGFHHEDNMQVMPRGMNGSSGKYKNPFWIAPSLAYKDWRDVPRHLWPVDLVPKYLALIEKHKGETIRWDAAA